MPMQDKILTILQQEASKCRIPNDNSRIEKDECMLSFDTPFSPQGLYTNINSWKSYGRDYVLLDNKKTSQKVYLYQKKYKLLKPKSLKKQNDNQTATKLAIGVAGGFSGIDSDYEIKTENMLCVLPDFTLIDLSENDIPSNISSACNGIIACKGISAHEDTQAWEEKQKESIHSQILYQVPLNQLTSPCPSPNKADWKCLSCGKTENLWFNLSDGYIGCGRKNYTNTSCGAAVNHYKDTNKKYPLAVKLGTITPSGADVWSYDEDDMVKNKNLATHLAHFGIDIMKQEKYDKTMEEMELEFNKNFVFGLIIESGLKLENITGPGFIGLDNLGNSCYMNSVLQIILSITEINNKYYLNSDKILNSCSHGNVDNDFVVQFTKLTVGCLSDRYIKHNNENKLINDKKAKIEYNQVVDVNAAVDPDADVGVGVGVECVSVQPRMLKRLVGRNHVDFKTNTQQDSVEYFRHFLEFMMREEKNNQYVDKNILTLKNLFKIKFEERLQCLQSNKVRYTSSDDVILRLDVDLKDAINLKQVNEYKLKQKQKDKDKDVNMTDNTANTGAVTGDVVANTDNNVAVDPAVTGVDNDVSMDDKTTVSADKDKAPVSVPATTTAAVPAADNDVDIKMDDKDQKDGKDQKQQDDPKVIPIIPLQTMFDNYLGNQIINGWMSPATNQKGSVQKSIRLKTFPQYLAIQIQRYYINNAWIPQKHEVEIPIPEEIDIEYMRGKGIQSDEQELPSGSGSGGGGSQAQQIQPDPNIVSQLSMFGLGSENACKRAAVAVQNANVEVAASWLMDHGNDPNINDPLDKPKAKAKASNNNNNNDGYTPDPSVVTELSVYGFEAKYIEIALIHTKGDKQRAVEWLFSHQDNIEQETAKLKAQSDDAKKDAKIINDGNGKYVLKGIISHLGTNTSHGHYVAHIKKNNKWYFYNDGKVAISKKTPFSHGYLYIFQRKT